MGLTDYGLIQIGSFIRGLSPDYAHYGIYCLGSSDFDGTKSYMNEEDSSIGRKLISWQWDGNDPKGIFILLPSDAVGSSIQEVGISTGVTSLGSEVWARELSAVGTKTSGYQVSTSFVIRLRRA